MSVQERDPITGNLRTISGSMSVDTLKTMLLDMVYPIGSIYTSLNNNSPANFLGGTWERIAQGRCLFGADDSNYIAGNTKDAGLPNITGGFTHARDSADPWGAFYASYTSGTGAPGGDGGGHRWQGVNYDASRSSNIYGKSSTVQPACLIVYMWKRTA